MLKYHIAAWSLSRLQVSEVLRGRCLIYGPTTVYNSSYGLITVQLLSLMYVLGLVP